MNLILVRQFENCHSIVANAIATIVRLFSSCRPSHVSRFISFRAIYSIDSVSRRRWVTNVCVKSLKTFNPRWMHNYSATAIGLIARICFGQASCFNMHPSFVHFTSGHSVCLRRVPSCLSFFSKGNQSFSVYFTPITSARNGMPCLEIVAENPHGVSAIALTTPIVSRLFPRFCATTFVWSDNQKTACSPSSSINKLRHSTV